MHINFYPWKMPRLNILSFSEQKDFDSPAELSGEERKLYFRKNNTINTFLATINSSSHKVAFALMLYHFKISKKFFPAHSVTKSKNLKSKLSIALGGLSENTRECQRNTNIEDKILDYVFVTSNNIIEVENIFS